MKKILLLAICAASIAPAFAQPSSPPPGPGPAPYAFSTTVVGTRLIGSELALTTNTVADITSGSLSPGEYEFWGSCGNDPASTTVVQNSRCWISTTSATSPNNTTNNGCYSGNPSNYTSDGSSNYVSIQPTGHCTLILSTTSTVYLSGLVRFTTSTDGMFGTLFSRKIK